MHTYPTYMWLMPPHARKHWRTHSYLLPLVRTQFNPPCQSTTETETFSPTKLPERQTLRDSAFLLTPNCWAPLNARFCSGSLSHAGRRGFGRWGSGACAHPGLHSTTAKAHPQPLCLGCAGQDPWRGHLFPGRVPPLPLQPQRAHSTHL